MSPYRSGFLLLTHLGIGTTLGLALPMTALGADAAKTELHLLQTVTLTDHQFLTGSPGVPQTVAGQLRLPRLGTDRLPAVVIVHGSGGVMGNEDHWANELISLGVATFTLDGFTARGIRNTGADQSQLGQLTMVVDAFRALDLLAADPRIDPARIGIMGGSRGARIVMATSFNRFRKMYGTPSAEFAVYVAFYTPCGTRYRDDTDVVDRPIRLFHGTAEDYVPVMPCRTWVDELRKAGNDVELKEYPGAYHLFDNPLYPLRRAENLQTGRHCVLAESADGRIVNTATAATFTFDDPCVERGVTLGYDARSHRQAISDVTKLLTDVFKLQRDRD